MARKRMAMGTIPGALEEDERLVELKVDSLKKDSRNTLGGNNPWGSGVNAQGLWSGWSSSVGITGSGEKCALIVCWGWSCPRKEGN